MSEEIITEISEQSVPEESKIPSFKKVCVKLGIMMIVVYLSRMVVSVAAPFVAPLFEDMDIVAAYAIDSLISFVFLYVIPITATVLLFRPNKELGKDIYKKPVYFGNAMGMFPAIYGVSILTNMLTLLISMLFAETDLAESFNTVNNLEPPNLPCALILLFQLVVIAPIFEELWFRGIVMENLRPYGNGFAIFVSALLFGFTHANLGQLFYTTVMGICLGYIAISTKSIVTTTIMHALFNSISGIMLVMMTFEDVQDYLLEADGGVAGEPQGMAIVFVVFLCCMMLLMLIGAFMAIWKIKKIKKYKVPKAWTELTTAKRWGVFFSRVTVIIMVLLAVDTMTFQFIPRAIYSLISGEPM